MYEPIVGDIIKIHNWHGVVLNVFRDAVGDTVLQVHTVRNVFRGYGPEFIELSIAPDAVARASREDLEREITHFTKLREVGLQRMLSAVQEKEIA